MDGKIRKNNDEMIRKIQESYVRLLMKFDSVCKKYDLQYWVTWGTLLGTIRHEGFIPWDDDLDIAMLREDYVKLCKIPSTEWGDEYLFCSGQSNDLRHDKIFGRVYVKNSVIQSYNDVAGWAYSDDKAWHTSLMCDIFVFDYLPENKYTYKIIDILSTFTIKTYKFTKLKAINGDRTTSGYIKSVLKNTYRNVLGICFKRPWCIGLLTC